MRKSKLASAQIVFAAQFVLLNASALWLSEILTKRWLKSLGLGTPTTGLHNIFKTFIQTFTIFRKAVAEYAFNSENNEGGKIPRTKLNLMKMKLTTSLTRMILLKITWKITCLILPRERKL